MPEFNQVTVGDGYTNDATLQGVAHSQGGSLVISGADCYMQIQTSQQGVSPFQWSPEKYAPMGTVTFLAGTAGVRVRNAVAGSAAVASASLAGPGENVFTLGASGQATPSSSTMITGIVNGSTGAIIAGTGFTVTKTGTGTYTIAFTNPFSSTPTIALTALPAIIGSVTIVGSTATLAPGGFTVRCDSGGGPSNQDFCFVAFATQ